MRPAARRRHTRALLAAALLGWVPLMIPAGAPAASQPIDCLITPNAPECESSSTVGDTSTSLGQPAPTEAPPTTSGTSPVDEPVTTAEPDQIDDVDDLTTTTLSVTTSSNLLVPGDGTEGAESTTTSTTVVPVSTADDGTSDATLIALVIVGLIGVAVAVAFLTWRYWVATRPPSVLPGA